MLLDPELHYLDNAATTMVRRIILHSCIDQLIADIMTTVFC